MTKAFNDVEAIVTKEESDMRTGALMLGVGRVANAIKSWIMAIILKRFLRQKRPKFYIQ